MNLHLKLLHRIAEAIGIESEKVEIDGNKILVGSHELPLEDVFFKNQASDLQPNNSLLADYLNSFEVRQGNPVRLEKKDSSGEEILFYRMKLLNKKINPGIYEITNADGIRNCLIFTGSLSGSDDNPDLTDYPEVILAMCLLDGDMCKDGNPSWSKLLESQGPFVISYGKISLYSFCECGLVAWEENNILFEWENDLPIALKERKGSVPQEAEFAYIAALRESTTPDVAFLKLYRVIEILFAGHFKTEISNADLCKVISKIQSIQSTSELDTIKSILGNSIVAFTRFSKDDFKQLFGSHEPKGNYTQITSWLKDNSSNYPPDLIRSHIIYYIRCSLVHSKMTEKEPFLIGPFSTKQNEALSHLVEDTRTVVRDLVF